MGREFAFFLLRHLMQILEGMEWMERYRPPMRMGHILLDDHTLIQFRAPDGYSSHRTLAQGEKTGGPGATIEVSDS